ncbi:MAG: tetraacyldisaccharide 4'-kinase [Rhodospirillales bacterium]|nr:tetraacyldisaccharide 4'-kinase [Rhodospirillales bacterium]MCB9964823.1 tetraacyldisaccharide 4'-kinase [Rhodospirillales bacterium]
MIKTPAFWYRPPGVLSTLLTPLSIVYDRERTRRLHRTAPPYRSSLPVICVGNLTAGGSGKTPVVLSLIPLLKDAGLSKNPCILSRGYGGQSDLHLVAAGDRAADVGDEALLLSRKAPVIVAKDRAKGAKMAENMGFDLIVMDDGFQNPTLYKTLSFLVVDGNKGFGNNRLIPSGPLREPVTEGLRRADAVIFTGGQTYIDSDLEKSGLPLFLTTLKTDFIPKKNVPYVAFCGLGRPDKFMNTLNDLGVVVKNFFPFSDHHTYTKNEVKNIIEKAKSQNARLITTEKDEVRLVDFPEINKVLDVVAVDCVFETAPKLVTFMQQTLRDADQIPGKI